MLPITSCCVGFTLKAFYRCITWLPLLWSLYRKCIVLVTDWWWLFLSAALPSTRCPGRLQERTSPVWKRAARPSCGLTCDWLSSLLMWTAGGRRQRHWGAGGRRQRHWGAGGRRQRHWGQWWRQRHWEQLSTRCFVCWMKYVVELLVVELSSWQTDRQTVDRRTDWLTRVGRVSSCLLFFLHLQMLNIKTVSITFTVCLSWFVLNVPKDPEKKCLSPEKRTNFIQLKELLIK